MHKNTLQHFQKGRGKCPLLPMPACWRPAGKCMAGHKLCRNDDIVKQDRGGKGGQRIYLKKIWKMSAAGFRYSWRKMEAQMSHRIRMSNSRPLPEICFREGCAFSCSFPSFPFLFLPLSLFSASKWPLNSDNGFEGALLSPCGKRHL